MPNDATDILPTRRSLLSRLKNCDDQAGWREFFDSYWKLIYGAARKAGLTDPEAQDAVQETVITVSKHIGAFQYDPAKCSFKTWLMLLTRQRIGRQFTKRLAALPHSAGALSQRTRESRREGATADEDGSRTATIERVPDSNLTDLEKFWDAEWERHLLEVATERVKRQVEAEHFQIFDLYVLQGWSAGDVAKTLRINVGRVYLAKHRIGRLLQKEILRLKREMR